MLKKISIDSHVGFFEEEAEELAGVIREMIKKGDFDEIPNRVLKTIKVSVNEEEYEDENDDEFISEEDKSDTR